MIYTKAIKKWQKYYTRKDYRANDVGRVYCSFFHYGSRAVVKPVRKQANRKLRRYKGDVANHGWYKKFDEVWWTVF